MKKFTFGRHTIMLYDSIDDMPIVNFNRYNKYLLIDSGIGSNLEDIDVHIEKIAKFINVDKESAIKELLNMRQALYYINQQVNPSHLAFTALIAEVDGVKIENATDDTTIELLKQLGDIKEGDLKMILEDIKKKVDYELSMFFPEMDGPERKDAYDKLKQRTQLQIDSILYGDDNTKKIEEIDIYFLNLSKPKLFTGRESAEVSHIKDFEKACILIAQETSMNGKTMTVLQFLIALEQIKKNIKNKQRSNIRSNG